LSSALAGGTTASALTNPTTPNAALNMKNLLLG
jgi:hypothetical protein